MLMRCRSKAGHIINGARRASNAAQQVDGMSQGCAWAV
jgi:hypothetical protein